MTTETLLLVEDDTDLLDGNREYFEIKGYRVLTAETLAAASAALNKERVDLILMDVNMPDGSGFDFIRSLRENSKTDTVVIYLTGRADSADIINGLANGGDDYVTKPYNVDVLYARIQLQLQKAKRNRQSRLVAGPLELDMISLQAFLDGENLALTQKEFSLLALLIKKRGEFLSAAYLYEYVWQQPLIGNSNALWTHMSRLKKKLEDAGNGSIMLIASRKEGYSLDI